MPGSSLLLQLLSCLIIPDIEHPPPTFTLTAAGNFYHSHPLTPHSCHSILLFIIPALLGLLDLMYEDGTSPFATHPKTMGFAVLCLLAYSLLYGAELSVSPRPGSHPLMRGMMLFGSLSLASLGSIFVPDALQWVVYMLYTLLCMGKFLARLPGQVQGLVLPTWNSFKGPFMFRAPLLRHHTFMYRGNILPL